jgi:ankyrin repeat protein
MQVFPASDLLLACTQNGASPLTLSSGKGQVEVARLLVEHKADVNQANTEVTMHKSEPYPTQMLIH